MKQNYKVFVGSVCLQQNHRGIKNAERIEPKYLLMHLQKWLVSDVPGNFSMDWSGTPENLFKMHVGSFKMHEAAGGLVFDPDKHLLMIIRHGIPDLPKGHLDEGEMHAEAALREVNEETGIHGLTILGEAPESWHAYFQYGIWHLKRTRWFFMLASYRAQGIPQKAEGITNLLWVSREQIDQLFAQSYRSLREILLPAVQQLLGLNPDDNASLSGNRYL